jgi:tetratricopeptide (TPR) repeat protein
MRLCRSFPRVVLAAVFLVAASASHAAAQIGRVGGVVKNEGGQPLKGATITADNVNIGQSFTATTDDKGRFTILGLRAGQWRFIAQAPGFLSDAGNMPVRVGSPNPSISFVLKRGGVAAFGALGGIDGKDLQSDLAAADAAFSEGRWDEAVGAYRTIMAKSTALSVINLQIAAAYRNKKDYPAALAAYNALLKVDPDNAKAYIGIAETNMAAGNRAGAEEALLTAAQTDGAGREVFFTLGEEKFTDNNLEEAARWYRKAAAADPFWGKPLYKLGLCAIKSGDAREASTLMSQVIAIDPVSPEAALAKSSLESLK